MARDERTVRRMAADAHRQQQAKRARFGQWRSSAKEELQKYDAHACSGRRWVAQQYLTD